VFLSLCWCVGAYPTQILDINLETRRSSHLTVHRDDNIISLSFIKLCSIFHSIMVIINRRSSFLATITAMFSLSPASPFSNSAASSSTSVGASSSSLSLGDVGVVGCGVLGTSLCKQCLERDDCASVVGITKSETRHAQIMDEVGNMDRFHTETMEKALELVPERRFKNIVFCAPPSGSDDYAASVESAFALWDKDQGGTFVFTSSGAVYDASNGAVVDETSSTFDPKDSPRAARLLYAEECCRHNDGTVLRLAGLYTLERGAHNFFLSKDEISRRPDGVLNTLHYDDAAGACLAALIRGSSSGVSIRKRTFLISDGHPSTRLGVCESSVKSKIYAGKKIPTFNTMPGDTDIGKTYNGSASNKELDWKPRYQSFDAFMSVH